MLQKYIIIHYDEIALKGDNRAFFEKQLMKNILQKLSASPAGRPLVRLERKYGRIVGEIFSSATEGEISPIFSTIFGIANWALGYLIARYETKNENAQKTIERVGARVRIIT